MFVLVIHMGRKQYVLSLSYGKDSIACIGAIKQLQWPLDRIIHAEVWATESIPADLPEMVEFKARADEIILRRWGLKVQRVRADTTFERQFYSLYQSGQWAGKFYGWPRTKGAWCNDRLKTRILDASKKGCITYVGIAADEPKRFGRLSPMCISPLVAVGWTEADCRVWCEKANLLSPIYTSEVRGGCWFCHNQGVDQLRRLRKEHPEYWSIMLRWDRASLRTFHADGHSLQDFELRFQMEDAGQINQSKGFRWNQVKRV